LYGLLSLSGIAIRIYTSGCVNPNFYILIVGSLKIQTIAIIAV